MREHSAKEAIAELLAPHRDALEATRRPVVRIGLEPMTDDEPLASKVGGSAYWPEGVQYPSGDDEHPLHLLAQVALEEAAHPDLPPAGLLQFFVHADDVHGANFDGRGTAGLSTQLGFRVVHWPAPLPPGGPVMLDRPASGDLPFHPRRPRRMVFAADTETISIVDVGFAEVVGDVTRAGVFEVLDELDGDFLREVVGAGGHKLGGYPWFTQDDPRRSSDPHRLLLQLDSDEGITWGDGGVAGFFITPDDLVEWNFSRVAYTWDCH